VRNDDAPPDAVGSGPRTADELARAADSDADNRRRVRLPLGRRHLQGVGRRLRQRTPAAATTNSRRTKRTQR